jgi:hypothetical protein
MIGLLIILMLFLLIVNSDLIAIAGNAKPLLNLLLMILIILCVLFLFGRTFLQEG